MIEPEVSRRCPDCGASIRERAFFCPHCGREIKRAGTDEAAPPNDTVIETAKSGDEGPGEALPVNVTAPITAGDRQPDTDTEPPMDFGLPKGNTRRPIRPLVVENGNSSTENRGHRDTVAAREVVGDNFLQRVEKFRKVSSVVLDQAAYDPSLRFVLVAALLFVIFLVILILNELV
jgi:hypothetical protein